MAATRARKATVVQPTPTAAQAETARVRARMVERLAEMDAEIARLLAAARAASPMWLRGSVDMWQAATERRAGYAEAVADALDALGEDKGDETP